MQKNLNCKDTATATNDSIAASIGRNTAFGILANFAQIGSRLISIPFVIHYLGLGGYGIWNIVMLTATYMRFGSVGVKTAFQKYVAEATGNGDYERANRLLSTGTGLLLALSLCGSIPAALFSLRIAQLAGVPSEYLTSAAGGISFLALIMLLANAGASFEAIVMGGHRIDLVRKFSTVLTILEAVAIIVLLHFGFGLAAMAGVMGLSELVYVTCCYFASRQIVPQVKVGPKYFSRSVLHELFRFAGSYQLVNILEIVYAALMPVAILRIFGSDPAGVYAVVGRVVASAAVLQEAFLPAILSAGTRIYTSGSAERMLALLTNTFKTSLIFCLFPMGFISVFGTIVAYAWTGETNPSFRVAFWLLSVRATFAALSVLSLVLYRVSGKALLDNVRQVVRIVLTLGVVAEARALGFYGVLCGTAAVELVGMLFMIFALTRTYHLFRFSSILPDTFRLLATAALIFSLSALVLYIPSPGGLGGRTLAIVKLGEASLACLILTGLYFCERAQSRPQKQPPYSGQSFPAEKTTVPPLYNLGEAYSAHSLNFL